jgi:hypothetical protein
MSININMTSLALILWSGMMVIAGSIWILSSQVGHLVELLRDQSRSPAANESTSLHPQLPASNGQGRVPVRRITAAAHVRLASLTEELNSLPSAAVGAD